MTINKFLEFEVIDQLSYKSLWNMKKKNSYYYNEARSCNTKFIRSLSDLMRYFP